MSNLQKKRILIFIDWYKPAYKAGGPIQSMAKMIEFQKEFFDFFIFCGNKDLGDKEPLANIVSDDWNKLENEKVYYSSKGLNLIKYKEIYKKVNPDSVYINGIFSLNFSLKPILFSKFQKSRIILAPRGMLGEGAIVFKKAKKEVFLFFAKYLLFQDKRIVWHATDENEFSQIKRRIGKHINVKKLSNFFPEISKNKKKEIQGLSLIFLSRISEKKNLAFAIECLSKLKTKVKLKIVGPIDSKKYFEKCKELLDNSTNLEYKFIGSVLHNEIGKQFEDVNYFILPTFHENFGHVIVESLSNKTPVIISENTPFKGLEKLGFGYDLLLNNKRSWIDTLIYLSKQSNLEYRKKIEQLEKNYVIYMNNTELIKKYQQLLSDEKS